MAQRQKNAHQGIPLSQTGCCTYCQLPAVQAAFSKLLVTKICQHSSTKHSQSALKCELSVL